MTFNGAIMQLVEMRENSMMPEAFKPYFDKVIETLSEVEPAPQWIPCSVRLPEKRGDYLVSLVRGLVTTQLYDNGFDADRKPGHHHPKNKVIAWMPKPKPYREGEC